MASDEGLTHEIENFDGNDFAFWRMKIEDYLYGKMQHLLLTGKNPKKCFRRLLESP